MTQGSNPLDRLEAVREVVDGILRRQPDKMESRCGFVHLYGVAAIASLLALKRGVDPQLSAVAGMLHDVATYQTGDSTDHARRSSREAGKILRETGCFTPEEIPAICTAILHHSSKEEVHSKFDELLKDADVLQHYLYNTSSALIEKERGRLVGVLRELGMAVDL